MLPSQTATLLIAIFLAAFTAAADEQFKLRVTTPQPTRFYLDNAKGEAFAPEGAIVYRRRGERHFVVKSGFEIALPAGVYTLVAERGPEYGPFQATITARAGKSRSIHVDLRQWIEMNRRGWYSGDLHNHRRPDEMPLLLAAEDLNVAPTLADWVWANKQTSMPPETAEAIRRVDATHVYSVLDKEVERLKEGPGAVDLLGLRSAMPFDGYLLYPPNDLYARQAHAQGGWVDAEKIVWRDVAAVVALGHVDFAGIVYNHFNRQDVETETDTWGMIPKQRPEFHTPAGMPLWAMEVYYRFLNCGFRLAASAGSASGVKSAPLGYNRVYVKMAEPNAAFGYDEWFRALKAGRSFATNGPMLFLTVNGEEPGGVLRFDPGRRRVRIHLEATSMRPMERLELLFNGRVVRTLTGTGKLAADFELEIARSGWFVARAFEKPDRTVRFAHTSPVYVEFAGDSGVARPEVREAARFFVEWIDRELEFYRKLPGFREPAHREAMLSLFTRAREVYAKLL